MSCNRQTLTNQMKCKAFYARSVHGMCVTCTLYMLCRLLMATGIAGVPSLTSNKGAKEFIQHQESWWNQYTDCINFSKRAQESKRRFKFQVQTDGISVSVLMFRPFPTPPLQANTATAAATPPPPGRKRKRHSRAEQSSRTTTGECVQGLPDRHLMQPARIVGLDPGRRALFTAVVHSQQVSIYAAPSAELSSLIQTELTDPFAACFWRYPDQHEP